jgi:simple sugar transport system substrate-binding protein
MIRGLGEGEFMQRYLAGAQAMARQIGIELLESTVPDYADMAKQLEAAIQQPVDALIFSHGPSDIFESHIVRALAANIKVVTFDMVVNNPQVPEIEQDDMLIGYLLCKHLATECSGKADVIYVNTDDFAPLIKRDRAWQDFKWRYRGLREVAHCTPTTSATIADTQSRVQLLLEQHPQASIVLALWDEFAKGAVQAITQAGKANTIRVYGVDITDADIQIMTQAGSPWTATVATDAYTVGCLAVRAAAALIVGEQVNKYLLVEPQLITQEFLRKHRITNMDDLARLLPGLAESLLVWPDWMEPLLERNGFKMPLIGKWAEQALREREAQLRESIVQQELLIETVRQLSTPVMPVHDRILVVPLIGNIDNQRSEQIMTALLTNVQQYNAETVIIDISGVPIVDTAVANHLIPTIQAVGLLGARCVLVGISPEVAQTVVQLGVDLHDLITRRDLRAGLDYALACQGMAIKPR